MKFDLRDLVDQNNSGRNRNRDRNLGNRNNSNQNKSKEKNNQQQKPNSNPNGRGTGNRSFRFERTDLSTINTDDNQEVINDRRIEESKKILENFLTEYDAAISERGNQVPDIILEMFWDTAEVITHYYERRYRPLVGQMNAVFDIIASTRFANGIRMVLTNEEIDGWSDGTIDVWKDVMFALSTVVTCCHGKMTDEVLSIYIDLISSDGIAGKDINRLLNESNITKDLALDLIISIPCVPEDMTDATLEKFHGMFLDKLMKHAEENISCLDCATQGKLFDFFFGKNNKMARKAIGRMLGSRNIAVFENNSQEIIYGEYMKMLFEKLNAYDIKEIQFVLRYIVSQKQLLNRETRVVYDRIQIAEYDNICKAYLGLIAEDPEAKKVFLGAQ